MEKQSLKPLPYEYDALRGISEEVVRWHHDKHQAAYVEGLNAYIERVKAMRSSGSFNDLRAVKEALVFNGSGMYLHELYWDSLGGGGGEPSGSLKEQIVEDFGSFQAFKQEFEGVAKTSRGWALLVWWPRTACLEVVHVDFHHGSALWGAVPVLCLDMWEHAYYRDRGPDKAAYIEAFFQNLDWDKVGARFEKVKNWVE